jgi:hypothetical protein
VGLHQATIRSPKLKVESPLRVHQGGGDQVESAPLKLQPGDVKHDRNTAGNPVVNVGVECPNKDNLRLGANSQYRAFIVSAANSYSLLPQGLAAFCEAEAAKKPGPVKEVPVLDKHGKPVVDKQGKPKTKKVHGRAVEWDPSVVNAIGAGGLTQFLVGTWTHQATLKGSYLSKKVAAEEETRNVKTLSKTDILAMRLDPETSINVAADYASQNLASLTKSGVDVASVADVDKMKLAYLAHHEQEGLRLSSMARSPTITPTRCSSHSSRRRKTMARIRRTPTARRPAFRVLLRIRSFFSTISTRKFPSIISPAILRSFPPPNRLPISLQPSNRRNRNEKLQHMVRGINPCSRQFWGAREPHLVLRRR